MNPRIQVEHTVTEEVTDVDLVQSPDADRVRRDPGRPRADAGQRSGSAGAALQCRITTEDPANGFRPDTGVITTYRSPGGAGRPARRRHDVHRRGGLRALRLDADQAHLPRPRLRDGRGAGAAGGRGVPDPRRRRPTSRSCRPCSTTPTSRRARVTTAFIEEHPQLLTTRASGDRGTKLLDLPRRRHGQPAVRRRAGSASTRSPSCPAIDLAAAPPAGTRQRLLEPGPRQFARGLRAAAPASRSPTPRSATPTSRCSPPGCAPATCSQVAGHVARTHPRAVVARVLGRGDVRRGAAVPRRGPVGAAGRAARGGARTSACRCCCAGATRSATRRTRPR